MMMMTIYRERLSRVVGSILFFVVVVMPIYAHDDSLDALERKRRMGVSDDAFSHVVSRDASTRCVSQIGENGSRVFFLARPFDPCLFARSLFALSKRARRERSSPVHPVAIECT